MNGVDAHSNRQGLQRHEENDQCGNRFHEHANKQKQNVDQQDDEKLVVRNGENCVCECLRNTLCNQNPAKDICCADQNQNSSRTNCAVDNDFWDTAHRQFSIDKQADECGVETCHYGSFCWRCDPDQQPTND